MSFLTEFSEPVIAKFEIFACRVCLSTETILNEMNSLTLEHFRILTGLSIPATDEYPQHLCNNCLYLLRKCFQFRMKCHTATQMLEQIRIDGLTITKESINTIDKTSIQHNLLKQQVININILENNDIFDDTIQYNTNILYCTKRYKERDDNDFKVYENDQDTSDDEILSQIEKRHHYKPENVKDEEDFNEKVYITVKQEEIDTDESITFDNIDTTESKLHDEYVKTKKDGKKKKNLKRKAVEDTRAKKLKVKGVKKAKIERKRGNTKDLNEDELDNDWRKIIAEIKEENAQNRPTKRKMFSKYEILSLIRKGKQFATTNNVEVKFLSKEEQKLEIEEKRNSEEYKKAQYKCEMCCKIFNSEETYKNHSFFHVESGGKYECEICLYRFPSRRQYRHHFYMQHTKKMVCKECGYVHRSWTIARQHFLWHQGTNQNIKCEECEMRFALRKNYLNHVRNKHGGGANGSQCLLCDRNFFNEKGLQLHFLKAHKDKPHCASCDVIFDNTDTLAAHLNAPGGCQKGHSACPKCGSNFPNESIMKSHYHEEHRKNCYRCEQCRRTYTELDKFNAHMNYHTRCNSTSYNIYKADELADCPTTRTRIKNNKGEKKVFVCEICGTEKRCFALLQEHQRTHSEETPYKCNVCQKGFKQKQNLKIHMATHTGERKYKCSICPKSFIQMQQRTSHMLTHTKERPYACTLCPKRYTGPSSLKDHVNTAHHGLPPRRWGKKKDQDGLQHING